RRARPRQRDAKEIQHRPTQSHRRRGAPAAAYRARRAAGGATRHRWHERAARRPHPQRTARQSLMSDKQGNLTPTNAPRKINLAEEMELYGVVVPEDIAEAVPGGDAVFLPYQQKWFEDESQIMLAEKSRRTGLTWAEAGRNVINGAKPRKRGGCNTFYV